MRAVQSIFLFFFISINTGYCLNDCVLLIPANNAPLYTEQFGTKTIIISSGSSEINLSEGETITGYCSSSFIANKFFNSYENEENRQIYHVTCNKQRLEVQSGHLSFEMNAQYDWDQLVCSAPTWGIYEIEKSFANCQNFMSYALGAKTLIKPLILAGLCYDLDNLSLKYINFIAKKKTRILEHQELNYPDELNETSLTAPISGNFNSLLSFADDVKFQTEYSAVVATNFWLNLVKYEYQPLIQSKEFGGEFNEFGKFLHIIWWKNLQSGNWKLFTDLLDKRINEWEYSVYMGTSGVVRIPHRSYANEHLVVDVRRCMPPFCGSFNNFSPTRYNIPEYIWSYLRLKSNDSSQNNEEFVVIGYNSPYYGYFKRNETIFCNDMCDNINWLKPIEKTRFMATMGIVFCCLRKDVELHLNGFPKSVLNVGANQQSPLEEKDEYYGDWQNEA